MGVPGFFIWLLKNYKKEGFVINKSKPDISPEIFDEINNIDYFLIDANCLIHPVCFKIIAENPDLIDNEKLENKMMNAVLLYLDKLIEYVKPTKGIYLAIDGVAPLAKIKQQRIRRFKSVADKIMWDSIKKKHSRPVTQHWNNNAITPGTEFMVKLHNIIITWANKQTFEVIYSSCFTPAEGEHKLLQYIRSNQKNNIDLSYVIYGLDADLIFLALSTNSDKIYLLREANEINKNESKEVLNHISIKIMRKSIVNSIYKYLSKEETFEFELNEIKIVNDFIFMCYFLGNDFLPHIPSLNIHNNGIENLIINYSRTIKEIILENNKIIYLIDNLKINNIFLSKFILRLSLEENTILRESFYEKKRFKKCEGDAYEKEVFKIDNLLFKINDPIKLGSDDSINWKKRYYKHYWNIEDDEIDEFSKKLVYHYLMGIKWVTSYYFDKCPSWNWYYPFDYPPFISDIAKYLPLIDMESIIFKLGTPLKPFMQLLSVLPPQSNYLIPITLRKLMLNKNSSLIYMYPNEFDQDFVNKHRHWAAIPKLPPLDIELVKHMFNKYQDELTCEEKIRNKIIDIIIINNNLK
jgi:5'-3' exonuclease